jgi:hypothetical protein
MQSTAPLIFSKIGSFNPTGPQDLYRRLGGGWLAIRGITTGKIEGLALFGKL